MIAINTDAKYEYDSTKSGTVTVQLNISNNVGYPNNCYQFNDCGHISVPNPQQQLILISETISNLVVHGYHAVIKDEYFSITQGESANYSNNWYHVRANTGIYMQPVNTTNKEHEMMGESTNKVLSDILARLIALESWANSHEHIAGTLLDSKGQPCTGLTGAPNSSSPSGQNITDDQTYISGNKNLAITDTYTPYS